jgi:hypothetical protein
MILLVLEVLDIWDIMLDYSLFLTGLMAYDSISFIRGAFYLSFKSVTSSCLTYFFKAKLLCLADLSSSF